MKNQTEQAKIKSKEVRSKEELIFLAQFYYDSLIKSEIEIRDIVNGKKSEEEDYIALLEEASYLRKEYLDHRWQLKRKFRYNFYPKR
jgi:hypothetical protein